MAHAPIKINRLSMAVLLVGVLALGMAAGMAITPRGGGANHPEDAPEQALESQIADFIEANPRLILETIRTYTTRLDEEQRHHAINLVKANDGTTIMGNPDGDVTIYEFSDYNCGYCKRSFETLMELARTDGNIRIVVKEYPILAQSSLDAAELALAAGAMGRFAEFHTALMTWPGRLDEAAFTTMAEQIGTNLEEMRGAMSADAIGVIFAANHEAAQSLNITGTPAFVVGDALIPGAVSLEEMQAAVAAAREAAKEAG